MNEKKSFITFKLGGQVEAVKKTLWQRFIDECKHYYSGFKLLFLDVRVSSKIAWKILNGHQVFNVKKTFYGRNLSIFVIS